MKKLGILLLAVAAVMVLSLGLTGCGERKKDAPAAVKEHPAKAEAVAKENPAKAKPKDHPAH